jgi:hypothetical protein
LMALNVIGRPEPRARPPSRSRIESVVGTTRVTRPSSNAFSRRGPRRGSACPGPVAPDVVHEARQAHAPRRTHAEVGIPGAELRRRRSDSARRRPSPARTRRRSPSRAVRAMTGFGCVSTRSSAAGRASGNACCRAPARRARQSAPAQKALLPAPVSTMQRVSSRFRGCPAREQLFQELHRRGVDRRPVERYPGRAADVIYLDSLYSIRVSFPLRGSLSNESSPANACPR